MKHLIHSLEPSEIHELLEQSIKAGEYFGPDPDRKYAEAWLRGWCDDRTTRSFEEALVIYLHSYIRPE